MYPAPQTNLEVSPQRIAMKDISLHDGTQIPKGTRVAFSSYDILMDPTVVPDPETFDGWRSYRKRQEGGQERRHSWALTDKDHLAFGHGKQACPGRHFAAAEIKIILSKLLQEYDFKFPTRQSRPRNFSLDENIFPDPFAKLMLRRRGQGKDGG